MRDCRGQASIEYLGVVGLLALVMGALAVPALAGQDIAGALVAQVRRALCVVSGGDCEEDRRPCVVDADETDESQHIEVGFLRYGQDRLTLREVRSDGTVAVTVLKDKRLGVAAGVGVDGHAGGFGFGLSMHGALLARLGSGSMIVFPNARAAERGLVLMSQGSIPAGAKRVRLRRGGAGAELALLGGSGSLRAADDLIASRSIDERDGRTTYALRGAWRAAGTLGLMHVDVGGIAEADVTMTLTRERGGRFVDLGLAAAGSLEGSASLPQLAGAVGGLIPAGGSVGRRWTVEQHLDLTDSDNRAAAAAFVHALGRPRRLPHAGTELARRLATHGVTDVRAYRLDESDDGIGGHIGAGGKLGGADEWHTARTHLLAALQRGPDGIWHRRTDCVAAV